MDMNSHEPQRALDWLAARHAWFFHLNDVAASDGLEHGPDHFSVALNGHDVARLLALQRLAVDAGLAAVEIEHRFGVSAFDASGETGRVVNHRLVLADGALLARCTDAGTGREYTATIAAARAEGVSVKVGLLSGEALAREADAMAGAFALGDMGSILRGHPRCAGWAARPLYSNRGGVRGVRLMAPGHAAGQTDALLVRRTDGFDGWAPYRGWAWFTHPNGCEAVCRVAVDAQAVSQALVEAVADGSLTQEAARRFDWAGEAVVRWAEDRLGKPLGAEEDVCRAVLERWERMNSSADDAAED